MVLRLAPGTAPWRAEVPEQVCCRGCPHQIACWQYARFSTRPPWPSRSILGVCMYVSLRYAASGLRSSTICEDERDGTADHSQPASTE